MNPTQGNTFSEAWHIRNLVLEKLIWTCRWPAFPGVHPSYLGSVNWGLVKDYYLSIMETKRNLKALQYFVCTGNINSSSPAIQEEHQIITIAPFWLLSTLQMQTTTLPKRVSPWKERYFIFSVIEESVHSWDRQVSLRYVYGCWEQDVWMVSPERSRNLNNKRSFGWCL